MKHFLKQDAKGTGYVCTDCGQPVKTLQWDTVFWCHKCKAVIINTYRVDVVRRGQIRP